MIFIGSDFLKCSFSGCQKEKVGVKPIWNYWKYLTASLRPCQTLRCQMLRCQMLRCQMPCCQMFRNIWHRFTPSMDLPHRRTSLGQRTSIWVGTQWNIMIMWLNSNPVVLDTSSRVIMDTGIRYWNPNRCKLSNLHKKMTMGSLKSRQIFL